jgi:hypothetical protein
VAASTSKKAVAIKIGDVKLGVPTDLAKRDALRAKLAKFLKRPITNLAAAIKSLQISFVVSVSKAPAIAAQSFEIQALPNKYRVETRKRRVTTRLSAGTYVAKVTVRLRDAKGRTFVTGSRAGEARFTVR